MIAVIFEFWPKTEWQQDYFDTAAALRPLLAEIDGFISVERFESLTEPGKFLSLSFWRDEAAVQAWREQLTHRQAQHRGRFEFFQNYRLRVASVSRDYGPHERDQAPSS